jgi:hypothetical protein
MDGLLGSTYQTGAVLGLPGGNNRRAKLKKISLKIG